MEDKNITKKDVYNRLRRIEGQIKGLQKMVENDSDCKEILVQIAAVRSAINKVGCIVLKNSAKCIMNCNEDNDKEENIEELITTLSMFLK